MTHSHYFLNHLSLDWRVLEVMEREGIDTLRKFMNIDSKETWMEFDGIGEGLSNLCISIQGRIRAGLYDDLSPCFHAYSLEKPLSMFIDHEYEKRQKLLGNDYKTGYGGAYDPYPNEGKGTPEKYSDEEISAFVEYLNKEWREDRLHVSANNMRLKVWKALHDV